LHNAAANQPEEQYRRMVAAKADHGYELGIARGVIRSSTFLTTE
jgi:hypothetical protein